MTFFDKLWGVETTLGYTPETVCLPNLMFPRTNGLRYEGGILGLQNYKYLLIKAKTCELFYI
jgi:hypothetical protein